jgi:hypothetical protein
VNLTTNQEPIGRSELSAAGYSPPQTRWLLGRADRRGLDGEPVLLLDELERLVPDLPPLDGEAGHDHR